MVERTLTRTSNSPLFRFQAPFRSEPKDYAYWLQEARRRKKSHQFDFRSPDLLSSPITRSAIAEGQLKAGSYSLSTETKPKFLAPAGHVGDGGKDAKIDELQEKIKLLELELNATLPHSQLYRLGAAAIFVSIISIVVWLATGVGIPFHPVFAFGVLPTGIGLVGIAFAIHRDRKQEEKNNR